MPDTVVCKTIAPAYRGEDVWETDTKPEGSGSTHRRSLKVKAVHIDGIIFLQVSQNFEKVCLPNAVIEGVAASMHLHQQVPVAIGEILLKCAE